MSAMGEGQGTGGAPVAGWYPDPHGAGLRWWDGQGWTQHLSAPAPAVAPAVTPSGDPRFAPVSSYTDQVGTTSWAADGPGPSAYPSDVRGTGAISSSTYGSSTSGVGAYGTSAYGAGAPVAAYGSPTFGTATYGTGAPTGTFAPGGYAPVAQYAPVGAKPTNGLATASLVLGIVMLAVGLVTGFYFGSGLAVILSVRALRRSKELAQEGWGPVGRARAGWGLGLSVLMLVVVIALRITATM